MTEQLLNQWIFQEHSIPQEGKDNKTGFLVLYRAREAYTVASRGSSLGKIREKQEDSNEE